jgi:hypothetical protein
MENVQSVEGSHYELQVPKEGKIRGLNSYKSKGIKMVIVQAEKFFVCAFKSYRAFLKKPVSSITL